LNYTPLHYQIALTLLQGVGNIRAKELLRACNDIEELFRLDEKSLQKKTGYQMPFIKAMKRTEALIISEDTVDFVVKNQIKVVFFDDLEYPRRLKNCVDAPLILYFKGGANLNPLHAVSIVGTRKATAYGLSLCRDFVASLKGLDILVVSGLAFGIDACVHETCLESNIPTLGVLGHGLDRIYPAQLEGLEKKLFYRGGQLPDFSMEILLNGKISRNAIELSLVFVTPHWLLKAN